MSHTERVRVVVLGGGAAGWMTAAALVKLLARQVQVRVIESADIGIVGVGEATLPHLRRFIATLGIDEAAFMTATGATFKLGIELRDWGGIGERYFHSFGTFGQPLSGVAFHHFWLRMRAEGRRDALGDYCFPTALARADRFAPPPSTGAAVTSDYSYAYHFDATRFAPFLRDLALAQGAVRTEGEVVHVEQDSANGKITALLLKDGGRIEGDLFVDCSGFRSLLLGGVLGEPWEDWSPWLRCDSAVAVPCTSPPGPTKPYTRVTAMANGWHWQIPLQHRVGNGHVYASAYSSDDEATSALIAALDGEPMAEPRVLRFRAGRRRRSWVKNVVAIGLASGFLEPLESTSIHLVQSAIAELVGLFPIGGATPVERKAFNAALDWDYDRIRDFLILHYHATRRKDSRFWSDMRAMPIPESLARKIALFQQSGHVETYSKGLFFEPSWLAVLVGQGIIPAGWDQRADAPDSAALDRALGALKEEIGTAADAVPAHDKALGGLARALA